MHQSTLFIPFLPNIDPFVKSCLRGKKLKAPAGDRGEKEKYTLEVWNPSVAMSLLCVTHFLISLYIKGRFSFLASMPSEGSFL